MRVELEKLCGKMMKFEAVKQRNGKRGFIINEDGVEVYPSCVIDVKNAITKKYLTDHVWTKSLDMSIVPNGSTLTFNAMVEAYTKRNVAGEIVVDYHIVNVENIRIINKRR